LASELALRPWSSSTPRTSVHRELSATASAPARSREPVTDRPAVGGIASFPPVITQNPYQRLLYEHLAPFGYEPVPEPHFKLGWLWRARRTVRILHFHWPQAYYSLRDRPVLSWIKLGLFTLRLVLARALGYGIVWTIHEVQPHERARWGIDRLGSLALTRFSHLLIAHDRGTLELARAKLGRPAERIELVRHGSYVGVYPSGRPREVVRAELGIPTEAFVFLSFGHIRAYKGLELLLEAFRETSVPGAALVVAGLIMDDRAAAVVQEAARIDGRIKPLLEFVPDERVAELFEACNAAVLARGDGGTSGALILSLSLGVPVVAARTSVYEEMLDGEAGGWLFEPGDRASFRAALEAAAGDPAVAWAKGSVARRYAESLRWPEIGEQTARLLRAVDGSDREGSA
jgi:beta-1,4-mannosyltransferase